MSAAPLPSRPPCGLTQEKVLALDERNRVPVVGGRCQNPYDDAAGVEHKCGRTVGAHPSETAPAAPLPSRPPCGLTQEKVLYWDENGVPVVGGRCQNLRPDETVCNCPISAHPSETAPAAPLPSRPPCGLTQEKVLALRTDVPLVGGLCQNPFRNTEGQFAPCGCPLGEHPSETAPAVQAAAAPPGMTLHELTVQFLKSVFSSGNSSRVQSPASAGPSLESPLRENHRNGEWQMPVSASSQHSCLLSSTTDTMKIGRRRSRGSSEETLLMSDDIASQSEGKDQNTSTPLRRRHRNNGLQREY